MNWTTESDGLVSSSFDAVTEASAVSAGILNARDTIRTSNKLRLFNAGLIDNLVGFGNFAPATNDATNTVQHILFF